MRTYTRSIALVTFIYIMSYPGKVCQSVVQYPRFVPVKPRIVLTACIEEYIVHKLCVSTQQKYRDSELKALFSRSHVKIHTFRLSARVEITSHVENIHRLDVEKYHVFTNCTFITVTLGWGG